jgi:UPF0755 protein
MAIIARLLRYLLGIAVVLCATGAGVGIYAYTDLNRPTKLNDTSQHLFTIKSGESVASIAARLEAEGLISSASMFRLDLKLRGAEADIQAGDFQLSPGQSPESIIQTITHLPTSMTTAVLIPEGWRIGQIADKLAASDLIDRDRFVALTLTGTFAYDFLPARPHGGEIEGYLFPDTYNFPQHGADREQAILDQMLANFGRRVTPDLRLAAKDRGYTLHQVITLASIVEREAQKPEERAVIAGVFYNRLAAGMTLDADPTTQYALGHDGDWWPYLRLDPHSVDNPFNTYVVRGLPPDPISNPGLAAIQAAANPAAHNYLYFVACGNGTHAFATTLEEHERNRVRCGNR